MKLHRKHTLWLLTLLLSLVLLPAFSTGALAATEENVSYLYYASEAAAIAGETTPASQTCTEVTTDDTAWGSAETVTWYAVSSDVTLASRVTVNGTVNLILKDGCELTAGAGINVSEGNTLNIYAQTNGTGALTATGSANNAGIGGGRFSAGGTVAIYGGTVTAIGGESESMGIGYGIGNSSADNGTLTLGAGVTMRVSTDNDAWEAYDGTRAQYMKNCYTVALSGGANASADGATEQSVVGAMETVTFTPNDGYHFAEFDAITSNGVTAEFDEGSVVVSGTPTGDVELEIPDAVANAVPFVPTFRTQSLVLSGQIGVNFFMDLSGLTPEQREASYVEFIVSGKGGTTTRDNFDAGHTSKNGLYYGFTCYVNSIQMADTITAVYHYSDGGEKTVEKEYSVKAYLDALQGLTQDEKMRSLAVAMKDYGYYAQQYLSRLRHFTLDVDYTAMPEGTAYTEDDKAAVVEAVAGYTVSYNLGESGIEKLNYSLLLDSSTGIYIYLTPSAEYTGSVTATVGGGVDNVAEPQSDGRWRIHIADISTHQLGATYTVTVTAGAEFTITISALSYARTMLNYDGGTAKEQRYNAMVSLYRFYDSAMDYAGRAH